MAPSISEIAHVTKRDSETAPARKSAPKALADGTKGRGHLFRSNPGHDRMFKSIVKTLEDAYLQETALTATELWYRADFSAIPEKSRPSYTAFCTYLRHKVVKGDLISRQETVEERTVRRGRPKAPFNRFANLYALPVANTVPTVTKPYADFSPLTEEQEQFAAQFPAIRDRSVPKAEQAAVEPEMPEEVEEPQQEEVAAQAPEPKVMVLDAGDRDQLVKIQSQLAEMQQQNTSLKAAVGYITKALAAIVE